MCGETRIPRDMCAGNTIPGETRIPMTPVASYTLVLGAGLVAPARLHTAYKHTLTIHTHASPCTHTKREGKKAVINYAKI